MFHMKRFTSKTQKTGELGEKICVQYLLKNGFTILETNYTQKHGEIDIIAKKSNKIHFIEVKSSKITPYVSYETYNPANNLTRSKIYKLHKTIATYLNEKCVSHETEWFLDLYCVFIDETKNKHKIRVLENIILD